MLEITALNKGELKNASQKLYKFCLEKGESIPEYTIRNSKTNQGFMYTAQCVALGHVGVGTLFPYFVIIECNLKNTNKHKRISSSYNVSSQKLSYILLLDKTRI